MHEPYEARRFEREEKKGSVHYGWRSFVRALNENRTRGLPFRRRTLYPLSYKGVASFSRLGLTPDLLYVRYNKRRIECRGRKSKRRMLPLRGGCGGRTHRSRFCRPLPTAGWRNRRLCSSSWFRTRTMGSKDPCAAVTPRRNVRERIGHVCPTAFRHADPTRFC